MFRVAAENQVGQSEYAEITAPVAAKYEFCKYTHVMWFGVYGYNRSA